MLVCKKKNCVCVINVSALGNGSQSKLSLPRLEFDKARLTHYRNTNNIHTYLVSSELFLFLSLSRSLPGLTSRMQTSQIYELSKESTNNC